MALDQATKERIENLITSHAVVLFMKGSRRSPKCGFSATVVEILNELIPEFSTVDVLEDMTIREGVKEYAQWPTIPQLYIKGEFIGGCDIVREMHAAGDLHELLGLPKPERIVPEIAVTDSAKQAFLNALEDADYGETIKIAISPQFEHELAVGPKEASDIEIELGGLTILIDAASAQRANGLKIDYRQNEQGAGFQINNPNLPPQVKQMTVHELKNLFDSGESFALIDVRTRQEWDEAHIQGARLFEEIPESELSNLDRNTKIVFQCRSGGRSQRMAESFRANGFRNIYNLAGGIRAWAQEIDPSLGPIN